MAEEDEEKPKSNSTLKILIIVLIVLFLVGGIVGGLFAAGVFGGSDANEEESDEEEAPGEAIYIPVDPAFVVNFPAGSQARFLQITLEIMTRSAQVEAQVNEHMPVIRNNLLMLFSSQTFESVSTLEGKESLREQALETVQTIIEEEAGGGGEEDEESEEDAGSTSGEVEAIYFTSFVMQ
jgi:flagellar FliL protein